VKENLLGDMIRRTLFAVSDNEARPVYTGSLFEVENGVLTIVAVDGYRLALRRGEVMESAMEQTSFIVPGQALGDVEKICGDEENEVRITVGLKHVSFAIGATVVVSRRLEGEFLNYRRSVPTEFQHCVKVQRTELSRVVDRVSLIIDAKTKNPLRCTFGDGEMKLLCVTNLGKAEDFCPISGTGGNLEIGFNNRYLLDALRAAPADELELCLNTASSPCVVLPADGSDGFVFMILPVRFRAD
jgi:DNA polymerase-3 subunit beta